MSRKPLIGLNVDSRSSRKEGPALAYVAAGYFNCVQAAGGIPIIVPPLEHKADLEKVLDLPQGFVMVGGGDLDPRRDGYQLHSSIRPMDPRREEFDRLLMRQISARRMPV